MEAGGGEGEEGWGNWETDETILDTASISLIHASEFVSFQFAFFFLCVA